MVPLFDPDTQMCFLSGKGDRNIQFVEIAAAEPFVVEGLKYSGEQTKGACLVPKRAMDVMQVSSHQGCQMAKFDPFLSLDCARVEGVGAQSKERKGSNFAA